MIERSSLGRELNNDGATMANGRSPSVALLDFTNGIDTRRAQLMKIDHRKDIIDNN